MIAQYCPVYAMIFIYMKTKRPTFLPVLSVPSQVKALPDC